MSRSLPSPVTAGSRLNRLEAEQNEHDQRIEALEDNAHTPEPDWWKRIPDLERRADALEEVVAGLLAWKERVDTRMSAEHATMKTGDAQMEARIDMLEQQSAGAVNARLDIHARIEALEKVLFDGDTPVQYAGEMLHGVDAGSEHEKRLEALEKAIGDAMPTHVGEVEGDGVMDRLDALERTVAAIRDHRQPDIWKRLTALEKWARVHIAEHEKVDKG